MPKSSQVLFILFITVWWYTASCKKEDSSVSRSFFVDSVEGKDSNTGMSETSAWKSIQKLNGIEFIPGDVVRIKRGSSFTGTLRIRGSGTEDSPVLVTDYGSKSLPPPAFTNTKFNPETNEFGNCIRLRGDYITVENQYCYKTVAELPGNAGSFLTMWELGAIYIEKNSNYCVIRNNEIFDCGVGIKSYGEYAVIKNNFIHDCNRILKKWNWGPIGIWLGADHQEVCYNRIENYSAVDPRISWGENSYGGGADGGAIEIDDARYDKSDIHIHHNFSSNCQGFIEVTWTDVKQNPDYRNFSIHHNISDDYQQFLALWRGADCHIENNTIIRRKINENEWGVFNITQSDAKNFIRNNIVATENGVVIFNLGKNGTANPKNIIENNLYWSEQGEPKFGLESPGKKAIVANPLFVDYPGGDDPIDFSIISTSPAIDKGLSLNYSRDFIDTPIPQGAQPDIGAFEFKKN